MKRTKPAATPISVTRIRGDRAEPADDLLAVEEPLQIRIQFQTDESWREESLTVTMRTPGQDFELATGFLLAEGLITGPDDILQIRYCRNVREEEKGNVVVVKLATDSPPDLDRMERNFITNSSCGVCGKSAIDAIICELIPLPSAENETVAYELIGQLNEKLEQNQTVFRHTGGLHASALFDLEGNLLLLREDIGRHNALDKVIGAALNGGLYPLERSLAFLSGRVSYELVQKAVQARIPVIVAVGAPSSLAVDLAESKGITLIGFLRGTRFNIYTHPARIAGIPEPGG